MKKLSGNHVLILITILSAFFCITFASCGDKSLQLQNLGTSITKMQTPDDNLTFQLSGSFEPDYVDTANIKPFRMRVTVFAQSENHATMRKIVHLTKKDFTLIDGKMQLIPRIYTFPNKVTKQAKQEYILKQDVFTYRLKK